MGENRVRCYNCGNFHDSSEMVEVVVGSNNHRMVCKRCYATYGFECASCGGKFIYRTTIPGFGNICSSCESKMRNSGELIVCQNCHSLILKKDAVEIKPGVFVCSDCKSEIDNFGKDARILDYHDSMVENTITFFGDKEDGAYLGIELEIDGGHKGEEMVKIVHDLFPDNFLVFEEDGSLSYRGIECITRPATYAFHLSMEKQYRKWFRIATRLPYKFSSHNNPNCGLHIHVNRSFFDSDFTSPVSDACIARLLYMIEKFWDELVIFSRRKSSQMNWCERYHENPDEIVKKQPIKGRNGINRYMALNLTNEETIEFRLFRGTMNIDTFFATLELVNNLITIAKFTTDLEKIRSMEFSELLTSDRMREYYNRVCERKRS